jgi:Ca2+-transporting ATPase
MQFNTFDIEGLSPDEISLSRQNYGRNILEFKSDDGLIATLKNFFKDPMIILLLVASSIYFVSGKTGDGIFMVFAILLVSAISLYQDSRSHHALNKLKDFTKPKCKVIRSGILEEISSEDLVVGDRILVEEGNSVNADGIILHSNDFSVNESILTGESLPAAKDKMSDDPFVYSGTSVASGSAIAAIVAVGKETKLGQIGRSLESINEESTPLELQINQFVMKMAFAGVIVFVIVWIINYILSKQVLDSLLKALTLAMSILPEEIPVAFTTFMALGAWRMMKSGVIVKQMKTVETLGSATVICTDKTGTITENKTSLAQIYSLATDQIRNAEGDLSDVERNVIRIAMWASEPVPFDPMEIGLHGAYAASHPLDERPLYKMIHEYALGGRPPMMTHLYENKARHRIIAAKGAPEALVRVCDLNEGEIEKIERAILTLASEGYRLLGVGACDFRDDLFPATQQELRFNFLGIVAFYDPPKKNINKVLQDFNAAGIDVKLITGDNAATTASIARQVGLKGYQDSISGDELMELSDTELQAKVKNTYLFTRMFPDAKLRIINALKANHEIVAMTGDGVNDGPALKASHIGIAMGRRGTEIAKQAASLILMEDDLSKMVDAIAMGRKIYANLKKAIQFIISIHIPIILTVFIPLALGWTFPNIFSPVHIIFLELIMGPTCSIVYENEPMEMNTMIQKPRNFTSTFFNWRELTTSIIQGLVITVATLGIYRYCIAQGMNESITRTMVFTVLITANIFLTLVNRSFHYSIFTTLQYKNRLVVLIIGVTLLITALLLFIKPLAHFFEFETPHYTQILISIGAGFISVIWFEGIKWINRMKENPL